MHDHDLSALALRFAPLCDLAERILPFVLAEHYDIAHGVDHLVRVWGTVLAIQAREGGDLAILCAATILHDCVPVSKISPLRSSASRLSAERARRVMEDLGWDDAAIDGVCHAILAHSFSAGIPPETLEARILQDADRIDALGASGIGRCLMLSGQIGRPLYDLNDPRALRRPLDPQAWTLDFVRAGLMTYVDRMTTPTGEAIARKRHDRLAAYIESVFDEIEHGDL